MSDIPLVHEARLLKEPGVYRVQEQLGPHGQVNHGPLLSADSFLATKVQLGAPSKKLPGRLGSLVQGIHTPLVEGCFLASKPVLSVRSLSFALGFCGLGRGQFGDSHKSKLAQSTTWRRTLDWKSLASRASEHLASGSLALSDGGFRKAIPLL